MSNPEQLITDYIDIWTSAILAKSTAGRGSSKKYELYGINKLRELILELAVRGKLVPQDPNDEPASVLLERIAQEKAELTKQGKIKKSKSLAKIKEDEKFFELPDGWEWEKLGNILNIFNGNSINAKLKEDKYSKVADGLPYIGTKDVGYGFESLNYENGVKVPREEPKFKIASKGSVLICAEGGSAGRKCGLAMHDIFFGNKLYANETFHVDINPKFILISFLSPTFFNQFSNSMTGIIGGISLAKFSQLAVTLPPKEEQLRIVAKVDELMLLCDQLEQQTEASIEAHATLVEVLLATLIDSADADELAQNWSRISEHFHMLFTTEQSIEALKQTILQLAVMGKLVPQDPNDEPASVLLDKIANKKTELIGLNKLKPEKTILPITDDEKNFKLPLGWEWCRFGQIAFNRDFERIPLSVDVRRNRQGVYDYYGASGVIDCVDDYIFDEPLLLIGEDGANLINRSTPIAFIARGKYWVNNHAHVIDGINENFLIYLSMYINSITLEPYITGTAQPKMNQAKMNTILVALPPLEEQQLIITKVDELMAICDELKEKLQLSQEAQVRLTDTLIENSLA